VWFSYFIFIAMRGVTARYDIIHNQHRMGNLRQTSSA
jgi:hypothetical protein